MNGSSGRLAVDDRRGRRWTASVSPGPATTRLMKLTLGAGRASAWRTAAPGVRLRRRTGRRSRSAPAGGWKTTMSPTSRVAEVVPTRLTSTRWPTSSVGSIDSDGIWYGLTMKAWMPSARPSATRDDDDELERASPRPTCGLGTLSRSAHAWSSAAARRRPPRRRPRARLGLGGSSAGCLGLGARRLRRSSASAPRLLGGLGAVVDLGASAASASASASALGVLVEQAGLDDRPRDRRSGARRRGRACRPGRAGSRASPGGRRRGRRPRSSRSSASARGNVRSTPTPNDCLRTVNVSRAPLPWRLMTMPSKTWVRRRVPSITWKWTRTRSPAAKRGTRRSWARSRLSMTVLMAKGGARRRGRDRGRVQRTRPSGAPRDRSG